jgi:hypothetical protein
VDEAIGELSGYITAEALSNEKKWVSHVLTEARRWRSGNPMLILNLLKEPKVFSIPFLHLPNVLGTPLVQNLDGECWFKKPVDLEDVDIHPEALATIFETYQLLMVGKKGSDLKGFYKKSTLGIAAERSGAGARPFTLRRD